MKVLFLYSLDDAQSVSKPIRCWPSIQFGISYLSSVLKAHGHQTQLLVLGRNNPLRTNLELLKATIEQYGPSVVCCTAIASHYPFVRELASFVKDTWPDRFLIIGGVHTSLNPAEVIAGPFDAICIGEGEHPLAELCGQIEAQRAPHGIANLWIKSPDGAIEKNPTRPFLQDLDALPFPDRTIWMPWLKDRAGDELAVLLGRGCPYSCTYCCNHAIKKVAPGKYVRMRSPDNIIDEISLLHKEHPAKQRIYFEVESIALSKPWLMEFCAKLQAFNLTVDNAISYGCNFRISPQSVDENVFVALAKANVHKINVGLESGSERVRSEILKRKYSNKDFLDVVSMARKHGMKVCVFNMIGLPGETYSEHMETASLNRQCQPDALYTYIFFPYPGTALYDTCIEEGFLKAAADTRMERREAVIHYPNFSRRQIQRAYTWFGYRVYKGHRPFWWLLMWTLAVKIRSNSTINLLFRKLMPLAIIDRVRTRLAPN